MLLPDFVCLQRVLVRCVFFPPGTVERGEPLLRLPLLSEKDLLPLAGIRKEERQQRGQRASRIIYDAVGAWAGCTPKQLTYYHCLDDERWRYQPS